MNVVKAAALGALAVGGLSQAARAADEVRLDNSPRYLQEQEKGRRPLMSAIDRTSGGQMMDDIGLDISGHIEAGYTWSFNNPADDVLTGRVFDFQHDELLLNQIDVTVARTLTPTDDAVTGYKDKFNVGFKMEWIYGQDSRLIHSNGLFDHHNDDSARNEEFDLTQAYLEFGIPVGNGLLVTAGKFVTPIGFETINPTTNPFYSHSFLFGFAIPFTHSGVQAKYNITDSFYVSGGVNRGWEQSLEDNNGDEGWSYLFSAGYTWQPRGEGSEPINVILSAITGPEQTNRQGNWRTLVDLIASTKVADQLTVAVNADYAIEDDASPDGSQAQWYGIAAYARYDLNDMFAINLRGEWFNDKDGARGIGTNVYEATFGVSIKPFPDNAIGSNLVIRPEVRYDYSEEAFFDSGTDHQQFTAGVDAIFTF
jgi:hypothetical protein